jgi:hypothetical protein
MSPRLAWWLSLSGAGLLVGACSSTSATQSTDSEGGADTGSSSGGGSETGGSSSGSTSSGGTDGATQDSTTADATGGGDAAGPVGDAGVCAMCGPGTVCLEHQVSGGAIFFPDDAGQCPSGRILSGTTCIAEPTFQCVTLPGTCSNAPGTPALAHCVCARSLCASAEQCTDVTPTLMRCQLLAP